MKKLIIILFLFVAGCSLPVFTPVANPLNQTRLAEIESAYGIALSAAVAYRKLPLCKRSISRTICAKRSVIVQLQNADQKVQITLVSARTFIAQNPTLDAFSVLSAASSAVSLLQSIEATNGVN